MITDIKKEAKKQRALSWYKERLQSCIERERLNHSYKRVVLLEMLYEIHTPVSAEQLYLSLSRQGSGRISINTVYRILRLLVSFDLVVRIETNGTPKYFLNTYEASCISVYCRKSGRRVALDLPNQWQFELVQSLRKEGIEVAGDIEMHIDCRSEKEK